MSRRKLGVKIAGIGVLLKGLPDDGIELLEKRYEAFLTKQAEKVWEINWGSEEAVVSSEPEFRLQNDRWVFGMGDFKAEWNPSRNKGRIVMNASEYTMESFLRIWYSTMLLVEGGGLFHAAGLIRDGRGFLFIGPSGSGKTTLTRKCKLDEVLSDELVAVRREGNGYVIYGTPFMGELGVGGNSRSARIDRFFVVHHDGAPGPRAVNPAEAVAELWGTLMCFARGGAFYERALSLCESMAVGMPCERFSLLKNEDPWRMLDG
ncbi:MAG: hypothetical protein ABIH66_07585 [bacterium]